MLRIVFLIGKNLGQKYFTEIVADTMGCHDFFLYISFEKRKKYRPPMENENNEILHRIKKIILYLQNDWSV